MEVQKPPEFQKLHLGYPEFYPRKNFCNSWISGAAVLMASYVYANVREPEARSANRSGIFGFPRLATLVSYTNLI